MGGAAVDVANLTARVANQSGVLDETSTNTRLLLDATEGLKDDLRKVHGEIESVHGACRALESKLESKLKIKLDSGPPPLMPTVGSLPSSLTNSGTNVDLSVRSFPVPGSVVAEFECREIVINGILKNNCEISQESLLNITFATLKHCLPFSQKE